MSDPQPSSGRLQAAVCFATRSVQSLTEPPGQGRSPGLRSRPTTRRTPAPPPFPHRMQPQRLVDRPPLRRVGSCCLDPLSGFNLNSSSLKGRGRSSVALVRVLSDACGRRACLGWGRGGPVPGWCAVVPPGGGCCGVCSSPDVMLSGGTPAAVHPSAAPAAVLRRGMVWFGTRPTRVSNLRAAAALAMLPACLPRRASIRSL